jgi:hypothetical protein
MKTYIVKYTSGTTSKVEVPDDTTVTFGGLIPGAKCDGGLNRTALRFYQKKNQIAVLTSVESFRESSVKVLEKQINSASKDIEVQEDGVSKIKSVKVTTEEWKNVDEPQPSSNANKIFNQLQIEG